nr:group II intron maturase-specific domain-containing protein [Thiocystis violacea]
MLGFTHYWGRSRNGHWVVQRKTAKTRFRRAVRQIGQWCRRHRHLSVAEQWQTLERKLKGHDAYYGITGNARALVRFRQAVRRLWRKWLNRRSYRPSLNWEAFARLLQRYPLPPARVVHSNYVA